MTRSPRSTTGPPRLTSTRSRFRGRWSSLRGREFKIETFQIFVNVWRFFTFSHADLHMEIHIWKYVIMVPECVAVRVCWFMAADVFGRARSHEELHLRPRGHPRVAILLDSVHSVSLRVANLGSISVHIWPFRQGLGTSDIDANVHTDKLYSYCFLEIQFTA